MTDHAPGLTVAIVLSLAALFAPSGGEEAPPVIRRTALHAPAVHEVSTVGGRESTASTRTAPALARGTTPA